MTTYNIPARFVRYELGMDELPYFRKFAGFSGGKNSWQTGDSDHLINFLMRHIFTAGEIAGLHSIWTNPNNNNLESMVQSAAVVGVAEFFKYIFNKMISSSPSYETKISGS